jgi:nitroreductase
MRRDTGVMRRNDKRKRGAWAPVQAHFFAFLLARPKKGDTLAANSQPEGMTVMTDIDASLVSLVSKAGGRAVATPVSALFLRRWSSRAMTGEPVPDSVLLAVFEAARYAPSAYNSQPWRFVYARKGETAFDSLVASLSEGNQPWAREASALIVAASKADFTPPDHTGSIEMGSASFDAGAAWASLAFQAALLGWTTHAMGGFDREKARAAVKAPASLKLEAIIALGKRGDAAKLPPDKQALEKPNARRELFRTAFPGAFPDDA